MATNESASTCQDNAFGPTITGCRDSFDFTLLFEQSFFSLVPTSLLILLAVVRVWHLSHVRPFVAGTHIQTGKVTAIACYAVLQLALLILWAARAVYETQVTLAAAVFAFAVSPFLAGLSWLEHARSPRPSALLNVYLLLSALFDAVQARTLWLKGLDYDIQALFTTGLAVKIALLLLEAIEKGAYLPKSWDTRSPEENAGIFNQAILLWLRTIFAKGRRGLLLMSDLSQLDRSLESAPLAALFWKHWKALSLPPNPRWVTFVLLRSLKWQFLAPVLPRLVQCAFTFCQPFLLQRLLGYLQNDGELAIGRGLIGAYAVVYLGLALSTCFYWRLVYRSIVQMRACLVAVIYDKTIVIDPAHCDMSAPIALMSTDIERIIKGLSEMHEIWANTVQVVITIWLLYQELGVACVAPAVCAVICSFAATSLSARADNYQVTWMEATQKRVDATAKMIASIKEIRYLGLSEFLHKAIRKLRANELHRARNFRYIEVLAATISFTPLLLSPVFTFLIFVLRARSTGEVLDITRMFTSLSLLQLMTQPLVWLFQAIPSFVASTGCLKRIGEYLIARSRNEARELGSAAAQVSDQLDRRELATVKTPKVLESVLNNGDFERTEGSRPSLVSTDKDLTSSVIIRGGEFGWIDGKAVLQNIDLQFPDRQLTMIIGPVASGKTTLCRAIIGELPTIRGLLRVKATRQHIAFCDQNPFLTNATARENIVAFSVFDQAWYESVIFAAGLTSDFAALSDGDKTRVGSRGMNLSGGQRQRVAIARAVYSRCSIMVFDDVLSGLDALTQQHVFKHVFSSEGLLRKARITAIFCTHAIDLLPEADYIVALGPEGRVEQVGKYEDLVRSPGYISSLSIRVSERKEIEVAPSKQQVETADTSLLDGLAHEEAMLSNDQSRRLGDIGVFKFFFSAIGPWSLLVFTFSQCGWAVFSTIGTVWLNLWSTANSHDGGNENDGYYLGVYAVFQALGLLFLALFAGYTLTTVAVKAGKRLHSVSLETVMQAPIAFFNAVDAGVTINRFSQDISLIDGDLPMALLETVSAGLVAIVQMILIAVASPYVAISYPFIIGILYLVQKFYLRTSRQLRFLDLEAKSPLYAHFLETVQGLATIRSFGWSDANLSRNRAILNDSQRPLYLLYMVQRWLQLVLDMLTMAMAVILVGVATNLPRASTGFIGVALINLMSINQELKMLVINWTSLETSLSAVSRTKSFSEQTASEHGAGEIDDLPQGWPTAGQIELKDVSGSYDVTRPERLAFQNISVIIEPGQKVAICGRSGSGKSSMIMALGRMIELVHGAIIIDNVNISKVSRTALRRRLNIVPQDFYGMDDTVARNLDPWHRSSSGDMESTLRDTGLWQAIATAGGLEAKLDHEALSQGQKQQFMLARAILNESNVVLLDEATSSVDKRTDEMIQRVIREKLRGKTIVAVAHRLDTILDFDKVIVMDAGKAVEFGPPSELIKKPSVFNRLCSAQGIALS